MYRAYLGSRYRTRNIEHDFGRGIEQVNVCTLMLEYITCLESGCGTRQYKTSITVGAEVSNTATHIEYVLDLGGVRAIRLGFRVETKYNSPKRIPEPQTTMLHITILWPRGSWPRHVCREVRNTTLSAVPRQYTAYHARFTVLHFECVSRTAQKKAESLPPLLVSGSSLFSVCEEPISRVSWRSKTCCVPPPPPDERVVNTQCISNMVGVRYLDYMIAAEVSNASTYIEHVWGRGLEHVNMHRTCLGYRY